MVYYNLNMNQLLEVCKKVKVLAYFGSYTRQEDFVEGVSDINIFAISDDKFILLELASLGYSPIVMSESDFRTICERGDPICYYVLYDSNVICGQFPSNLNFNLTSLTCERLKRAILSFLSLSISAFFRNDEISTVVNSFRAIRNTIQWKSCTLDKSIPIKISELKEKCKKLNMSLCNEFSDIVLIKKLKAPLSMWSLDRVTDVICKELNLNCVKPSKILESVKNPVQVIVNDDGSVLVKDYLGKEMKLS